jgi:hypothetical protein
MVIAINKKNILVLSAIFCVFMMFNTVTAIPQQQSNIIMDKINDLEDIKSSIYKKITDLVDYLSLNLIDKYTTGFIENLINFLIKLIEFLINIAEFVSTILNIGQRILAFINQINYIIDTIINIINWLLDLFTPAIGSQLILCCR